MSLVADDLDKRSCPAAIFCSVQEIVTRLHKVTTWRAARVNAPWPHELFMRNLQRPVNATVISSFVSISERLSTVLDR